MTKWQSIGQRFLKAFVSGFLASSGVVVVTTIHAWNDLRIALNVILLAGTIGGINGVIMGADKWWNWTDDSVPKQ